MKLSKLFLFAAFLTPLLGSCSKDSDLPDSGITGLSDEIQLVFNGSSDGEIYTRGIATESRSKTSAFMSLPRTTKPTITTRNCGPQTPGTSRPRSYLPSRGPVYRVRPPFSPVNGKPCLT